MGSTSTTLIVDALTKAIVEHRLLPGAKLAEQKIADHFRVSRTIVRQALFQLKQKRLVTLTPARGAFVATPSVDEAKQVFAVRRLLEAEMVRSLAQTITHKQIAFLKAHIRQEGLAVSNENIKERTELLGDFHVHLAKFMGNQVLAEMLGELISRCALIALMYQSRTQAQHSTEEHVAIVAALAKRDGEKAAQLTLTHLEHVEANLTFDRKTVVNDFSYALI